MTDGYSSGVACSDLVPSRVLLKRERHKLVASTVIELALKLNPESA